MNYNVLALDEFKKNAKKLSKRYKKIKLDILELVNQLESDQENIPDSKIIDLIKSVEKKEKS